MNKHPLDFDDIPSPQPNVSKLITEIWVAAMCSQLGDELTGCAMPSSSKNMSFVTRRPKETGSVISAMTMVVDQGYPLEPIFQVINNEHDKDAAVRVESALSNFLAHGKQLATLTPTPNLAERLKTLKPWAVKAVNELGKECDIVVASCRPEAGANQGAFIDAIQLRTRRSTEAGEYDELFNLFLYTY